MKRISFNHFNFVNPKLGIFVVIIFVSLFVLSYRLLEIPPDLTIDESSLGANALLLARTTRDETGRLIPIFTLTINKTDWKQPITQYYMAGLFKIFPPSVWLLRFSQKIALLGWLIYLTTPLVVIHAHLATENIMPVLFGSLWLWSVYRYRQSRSIKDLILNALILGSSFYCYRGMRAITPVWAAINVIAIVIISNKYMRKKPLMVVKNLVIFCLCLLPFFAIIPWLEVKYAGAVFNNQQYNQLGSIYDFIYAYLSSYDLGFLFVKGDDLLIHSTQIHGMFLLTTLPIFILGIYKIIKSKSFFGLLTLIAFFTTPILYGWANSIHRASRLLALVPFFVIIASYGIDYIMAIVG